VRDDVLCVVLYVVLVIELSHAVVERISVLGTVRVTLLTFTALDATQDDGKEA